MASPPVSAVIPCHNAEAWIGLAVERLLVQSDVELEVIVVDDGSTDDSAAEVSRFGPRLRLLRQPNMGVVAARRKGLAATVHPFVLFHDADDYLEGPFLGGMLGAIAAADADLCFGDACLQWADGRRVVRPAPRPGLTAPQMLARVLGADWLPLHAVLWSRAFAARVYPRVSNVLRNDDMELIARALLACPRMAVAAGGAAVYVQHDSPRRVSGRQDAPALASHLAILRSLNGEMSAGAFTEALPALGGNAYALAREAFSAGEAAIGAEALALARRCGVADHLGSSAHRVGAHLLGLQRKERLAAFARDRAVGR